MALVRTDVREERIASIIRVKGISELETTLASVFKRVTRRHIQESCILHEQLNFEEREILSCS
jgi:hypothetical protein